MKHKKLLVLSVLFILTVLFVLLAPKPKPVSVPPVVITPTISSSAISFPTLVPPAQRPRLNLTWSVTPAAFPTELPYYTNPQPLLTKALIQQLANSLGFKDTDLRPDTLPNNFLYIQGTKSLFASLSDYQMTYTDTTIPATAGNWPTAVILNQTALKKINQLFSLNLVQTSDIVYLKSAGLGVQPAVPTKAQFTQISYSQTLSSYPYITTSSSNNLINAIFDQQYNLHYLQFLGGFTTPQIVATQSLINFETLKQISPSSAQIISSSNNIQLDIAISASPTLNLDVDSVTLAYFNQPNSNLIQPVFLLKGAVTATNIPSTRASFIVPAFTAGSYQ